MQHLQALAPFVPSVQMRTPKHHLPNAHTVRIEDVGLFRTVSPSALFALVGDFLVDSHGDVAPRHYGAGGGVFQDANAAEVRVLVAHALGASPAGDFLALHELVAHPVALLGNEAGSVGYSLPEDHFVGLAGAESYHNVGDFSPPSSVEGLVIFQGDVPGAEGQRVGAGGEYARFEGRCLRAHEGAFQYLGIGGFVFGYRQFVDGTVEAAVDRYLLILEETGSAYGGAAYPKLVVLGDGRELEGDACYFLAVYGQI